VTNINVSTQPAFGGTCPVCHAGTFESGFTLCGWLCCLFCFPCGIICCLCMPHDYHRTCANNLCCLADVTNVHISTQQPIGGTCPICHVGKFESAFTIWGWLCCIFCFPCGIICCLCMRKKKCNHCGFSPS
ncbi:brain protein I3, partial [Asbolus verrucosus]